MQDFRNLAVWEKSHQFVLAVYDGTAGFPVEERYGQTSQLRRCAVSITSNIATGCGRGSQVDLARCLQIALGSSSEAEYQLLLGRDLGCLAEADYQSAVRTVQEIKPMLTALIKRVRRDEYTDD